MIEDIKNYVENFNPLQRPRNAVDGAVKGFVWTLAGVLFLTSDEMRYTSPYGLKLLVLAHVVGPLLGAAWGLNNQANEPIQNRAHRPN